MAMQTKTHSPYGNHMRDAEFAKLSLADDSPVSSLGPMPLTPTDRYSPSDEYAAHDELAIPSYLQSPKALPSYTSAAAKQNMSPISRPKVVYNSPVFIPPGVYHADLAASCEFITPPNITPVEHPTPTGTCHKLFLGQVRFETKAADVRWLIRHLAGITALKVETRGTGCFLAYFRSREDIEQVKMLHKRILFDHNGVWFARTEAQTEIMQHYIEHKLQYVQRGFKLPKDAMVVEEEKMKPTFHRSLPPPPQYFNGPPQY